MAKEHQPFPDETIEFMPPPHPSLQQNPPPFRTTLLRSHLEFSPSHSFRPQKVPSEKLPFCCRPSGPAIGRPIFYLYPRQELRTPARSACCSVLWKYPAVVRQSR